MPSRANALASVPPDMTNGTTRASGSSGLIAAVIASISGPVCGAAIAVPRLTNSRLTFGPSSESTVARNSSSQPGSTRPSTYAVADPGTTLTLYPASSIVGAALHRIVADTNAAAG